MITRLWHESLNHEMKSLNHDVRSLNLDMITHPWYGFTQPMMSHTTPTLTTSSSTFCVSCCFIIYTWINLWYLHVHVSAWDILCATEEKFNNKLYLVSKSGANSQLIIWVCYDFKGCLLESWNWKQSTRIFFTPESVQIVPELFKVNHIFQYLRLQYQFWHKITLLICISLHNNVSTDILTLKCYIRYLTIESAIFLIWYTCTISIVDYVWITCCQFEHHDHKIFIC